MPRPDQAARQRLTRSACRLKATRSAPYPSPARLDSAIQGVLAPPVREASTWADQDVSPSRSSRCIASHPVYGRGPLVRAALGPASASPVAPSRTAQAVLQMDSAAEPSIAAITRAMNC